MSAGVGARVKGRSRVKRVSTGIAALDRVLGGGLALGSLTLVTGQPGAGKTTLLMQALGGVARRKTNSIFVSTDQRVEDVLRLARRVGCKSERVAVAGTSRLIGLTSSLRSLILDERRVLVVDPITMCDERPTAVLRAVTLLWSWARDHGIAVLMSAHAARSGAPRVLTQVLHLVDTALRLAIVGDDGVRELSVDGKHRFGATAAKARLRLTERGFTGGALMLVFTDVETTGLFESEGHLLEVALVLTDDALTEVAHISTLVRPAGRGVDTLEMDDVVRKMHTANGLLDALEQPGVPRRYEAEALFVEWVMGVFKDVPDVATEKCAHCGKRREQHTHLLDTGKTTLCGAPGAFDQFAPEIVPAVSVTPLAGSTVSFDRRWLRAHMPDLERLFSHRSVDVSSFTEVAKRWAPAAYAARPRKAEAHRALADVRESIEYLKFYRAVGFVCPQCDSCKGLVASRRSMSLEGS